MNDEMHTAVQMSALYYSVNLLRILLSTKLITAEEYNRILRLYAEHYDPEKTICLVS